MIAILVALAAGLWLGVCAGVALALYVSARHDRMWDAEIAEAVALTMPPTDTPIHDDLAAERLRAELDRDDAAERIGRWSV